MKVLRTGLIAYLNRAQEWTATHNFNATTLTGLGSNLIANNPAFAADSGWTKGTGWTIGSGVATSDASQAGDSDLTQAPSTALTSGNVYQAVFEVTAYTAGNVTAVVGDQEGTDRASAATFTEYITASSGADLDLRADLNFSGSVDNVTLKATNVSWDLETNQVTQLTLDGNLVIDNPTNMIDGAQYAIRLIQDGTGSRTVTWGSNFRWPSGTAPLLQTAAAAEDIIVFWCNGSKLDGERIGGIGGSALANVVEDTSPELGGNLEVGSFNIGTQTGANWVLVRNTVTRFDFRSDHIQVHDDFRPNSDNAHDLGSSSASFKEAYLTGSLVLTEAADHGITPAATEGQLWLKNTTPNELWFTDDAGTDVQLGTGGGISNVVEDTTPQLGGDLDILAQKITTSTANGSLLLEPLGTGVFIVRQPSGVAGTDELQISHDGTDAVIESKSGDINFKSNLDLQAGTKINGPANFTIGQAGNTTITFLSSDKAQFAGTVQPSNDFRDFGASNRWWADSFFGTRLSIREATDQGAAVANSAYLQTEEISTVSELVGEDSGGTRTQLTRHASDAPDNIYVDVRNKGIEAVSRSTNRYKKWIVFINEEKRDKGLAALMAGTDASAFADFRSVETFDEYKARTGVTLKSDKWEDVQNRHQADYDKHRVEQQAELKKWNAQTVKQRGGIEVPVIPPVKNVRKPLPTWLQPAAV